jgi:hypothetical protein
MTRGHLPVGNGAGGAAVRSAVEDPGECERQSRPRADAWAFLLPSPRAPCWLRPGFRDLGYPPNARLCGSCQVRENASFVAAVPGSLRGQAFGGMCLGQGAVMTVVLPLPGTPTPLRYRRGRGCRGCGCCPYLG